MIPTYDNSGNLPPGIHWATWGEIVAQFGTNDHRKRLLQGLKKALDALQKAGCDTVYLNGSFVANKPYPADFDCCWDVANVSLELLDPVLKDFTHSQAAQKSKYGGESFPILPEQNPDLTILDWFQKDKTSGEPKGIVAVDLRTLP